MGSARHTHDILEGLARITDFATLHMDPGELDEFINQHGSCCKLRRAVRCPCRRLESGHAAADCRLCNGTGFTYPAELEMELVALVLNRNAKRNVTAGVGDLVTGTVVCTFPLGVVPAQGDQLLPDGEQHVVQETMYRAGRQTDPDRIRQLRGHDLGVTPPRVGLVDRLLYPDVVAVEALHYIEGDGADTRLAVATGADYELVGREIRWRDGRGPAPGKAYTVRYRAPAAYMVRPAEPILRVEYDAGLPYRCEAQRLDRWGEGDLR